MTPRSRPEKSGVLTVHGLARFLFAVLTVWLVFVACLHLVFIFRFTYLLGHFPVPMIDDPKNLNLRDRFCDWYIGTVQWRFDPLTFYLANVAVMTAHIGGQLFMDWRRHRVRLALTLLLFGLFATLGCQIMFWLED